MTEILLAWILALLLIAAASVQLLIARRFRTRFTNEQDLVAREVPAGRVAVLLAVRGADPSIRQAIEGVLNQRHEDFQLHIVIDHPTDPAVEIIDQIRSEHSKGSRILTSFLDVTTDSCSLKCLSLAQAASQLTDDVEYVVLLDADVTPYADWLNHLLLPLANENVGGVTGTQWFAPPMGAGLGSWLRSVWNGGAAILTMYFANPWAGSFAMRRRDLVESDLVGQWLKSAVDDGPIRIALGKIGKQVAFAKPVVMVNRESCSLFYTLRWSCRMLTWSRLHEPTFWITILHALFSNFVMLSNFAVLFAALAGLLTPACSCVALGSLVIAGVLCVAAYLEAIKCVNHSLGLRGAPSQQPGVGHCFWAFVCAAPAHLMFGGATLFALVRRSITWRGINYAILPRGRVKRLGYAPYCDERQKSGHSI